MLSLTATIILLVGLVSWYVGFRFTYWTSVILTKYQHRRFVKPLLPTDVDEERLCKIHKWGETRVMNDNNEFDSLTFCEDCGFIPERNIMASQEGLKKIIDNTKLVAEDEAVKQAFIDKEMDQIKGLFKEDVEKGLDIAKVVRVYNAGQMSRQRFIIYKTYLSEEKE